MFYEYIYIYIHMYMWNEKKKRYISTEIILLEHSKEYPYFSVKFTKRKILRYEKKEIETYKTNITIKKIF